MAVTRSDCRSSLYHPVPARLADRQGGKSTPAVRSLPDRVTSLFCASDRSGSTVKPRAEIDARNLFILSRKPGCGMASVALVFSVTLAGLVGAIIAVVEQVSR